MKLRSSSIALLFVFSNCGQQPKTSQLKERWNEKNDPYHLLPNGYEINVHRLSLSGKANLSPWSDSYWPSYQAGISKRWSERSSNPADYFLYTPPTRSEVLAMSKEDLRKLSPAEKFSIYVGDYRYTLVQAERVRTSPTKLRWEGICNGWAAASMLFSEPKPVELQSVEGITLPFGASDVKALLSYYMAFYGQGYRMISERCESREDKASPECRDMNAGSFHILLANYLGYLKRPFLMDIAQQETVWNHPIYGFDSKVLEEKFGASPGAAPGTVKEVSIQTKMTYATETEPTWEQTGTYQVVKHYEYRLELDARDNIIGGEWLQENRPDFGWQLAFSRFYDAYSPVPVNGVTYIFPFSRLTDIYNASIK
jgi:hypothetical protein